MLFAAAMTLTRPRRLALPAAALPLALLAPAACGSASRAGANPAGDAGEGSAVTAAEADGAALDGAADAAATVHPEVVAVPLSTCGPELVYTASATLGASQHFQFLVDTGSTSVGVASSACSTCGVSPEYTPGTGAVNEHETATSDYGTGSWTGAIFDDQMALGTDATHVRLAAIDTQSDFFQLFTCGTVQGVVGFGPAGAALAGTTPFFDDLVASSKIPDVFATELCDGAGTLWLGGYDPASATADPQYVPLTAGILSKIYYSVVLSSVAVGGTTVPIATEPYPDSVLDTGTSAFLLGTSAYDALTAAIQADAGFTKVFGPSFFSSADGDSCAITALDKAQLDAELPPLTLKFGSVSVQALPTESYLFPYEGKVWCSALATDPSVSAELPLSSIVGSPILRSNVVVFDRAQKRVGFAPHAACP